MSKQTFVTPDNVDQSVRAGVILLLLGIVAYVSGVPQMLGPFSATCALVAILPGAPFSKPKTILVSHLLCIGIGAVALFVPGSSIIVAMVAAWVAIMAMMLLRVLHAPAVAHTVILAIAKPPLLPYAAVVIGCACLFALYSAIKNRVASAALPVAGITKA
jgi:CBS-domain-containing membrane protein